MESSMTLLGVGAISKNIVDATIELANQYKIPIILIASRRQVECAASGGGYVFTTEDFVKYVRKKDTGKYILIERDHGGLWQNNHDIESNLNFYEAEESAKLSFYTDIKNGFDIIHIDTSIDIHGKISIDESIERLLKMYEYCDSTAKNLNKDINIKFEIGSEEQSGNIHDLNDLEYTIKCVIKACKIHNMKFPCFIVAQTGTKVMETKNIGNFDENYNKIKEIVDLCNKYGIMLKQHNTDYLSDSSLKMIPKLGIHSANVAPEFGVIETKSLIEILEKYELHQELDQFLAISYASNRWKKWMLPNIELTQKEKAIISGHYIFKNKDFLKLKENIKYKLKNEIDLDEYLKNKVKNSIIKYLRIFYRI